jgi:hypothetical protein
MLCVIVKPIQHLALDVIEIKVIAMKSIRIDIIPIRIIYARSVEIVVRRKLTSRFVFGKNTNPFFIVINIFYQLVFRGSINSGKIPIFCKFGIFKRIFSVVGKILILAVSVNLAV